MSKKIVKITNKKKTRVYPLTKLMIKPGETITIELDLWKVNKLKHHKGLVVKEESNKFVCAFCGKTYGRESFYIRHLEKEHGDEIGVIPGEEDEDEEVIEEVCEAAEIEDVEATEATEDEDAE